MKLKHDKISKLKRLPPLPKNYLAYINSVRRKAKKYGIEVFFSKEEVVYDGNDDNIGCGGFFSEELMRLATSTNHPFSHWFPIFIHESCHMEQWIERREWFESKIEVYSRFFEWLNHEKEYTRKQLEESRKVIIEVEQDCEKRVVEKIKQYNFNFSVKQYTQKANCYLYLYSFMLMKRKWYNNVDHRPICWSLCPAKFPKDYKRIPRKLLRVFTEISNRLERLDKPL